MTYKKKIFNIDTVWQPFTIDFSILAKITILLKNLWYVGIFEWLFFFMNLPLFCCKWPFWTAYWGHDHWTINTFVNFWNRCLFYFYIYSRQGCIHARVVSMVHTTYLALFVQESISSSFSVPIKRVFFNICIRYLLICHSRTTKKWNYRYSYFGRCKSYKKFHCHFKNTYN